jgi:thiamine biosynthesis lipoprotein
VSALLERRSFAAFGGTVEVASEDAGDPGRAEALFAAWEDELSRFRATSALCRLNDAGRLDCPPESLVAALRAALEAAADTEGLVDPTMLPALEAAGYDRSFEDVGTAPADAPPVPLATGRWRSIAVSDDAVTLPPGVRVDLGGVAKGLAVDRALALLHGERAMVNAAGDLRVRGGGWSAAIAVLPDGTHAHDATVVLDEGALATSGITRRRWTRADGSAGHHLIDPRTGLPAAGPWLAVTTWAPTCVGAEVAAKAALIAGADGPAWLEARGIPARLVGVDGSLTTTGAWAG